MDDETNVAILQCIGTCERIDRQIEEVCVGGCICEGHDGDMYWGPIAETQCSPRLATLGGGASGK